MKQWRVIPLVGLCAAWTGAQSPASAQVDDPFAALLINPVVHPIWTKKPDGDDLGRLWPAHAKASKGDVTIVCLINERGAFSACEVIKEEPKGQSFGANTMVLAQIFRMKTTDADGEPVAGRKIVIPVRWCCR